MELQALIKNAFDNKSVLEDMKRSRSFNVLLSMLGPAVRGFLLQKGKHGTYTEIPTEYKAYFNWDYKSDNPEMRKLYDAAKRSQWNGDTQLDWNINVDPYNEEKPLLLDTVHPLKDLPAYKRLPKKEQLRQRHAFMSWTLSQFLHGEQGALFAACQVTQSVRWLDGKLYGSTQVMDEGRHVEVFHRYLSEKLDKVYQINDNLYVIVDALMSDSRWDIKFLGMQIMIEGLALGAFGTIRQSTQEPLLQEMLKYVIMDEGRHVHYGVVALKDYYTKEISPSELREREDWAFEVAVLLRNRFLVHEFYDEFYGHVMTRDQWNKFVLESDYMKMFRNKMFKRLIPNLKKINLLSDRIRPHYQALGLLEWENEKASPELSQAELLE